MNKHISNISLLLVLLLFVSSCTSLQNLTGGRTDLLKKNEFYKTYSVRDLPDASSRIGLLPVTVQPNMDEPDFEYDRNDPLLTELTDTLNARLSRLITAIPVDNVALTEHPNGPGIYVGSAEGENVPAEASVRQNDFDKYPPMIIYMDKARDNWKEDAGIAMLGSDTEYLLRIWVSFAEYPKADKGLVKRKVVLGTHHEKEIRFFSSEDKPVEVLQLSGYLVDKSGNVVRAGAEGVIHNDTPFWLQVLDVKELIDDKTLIRLLEGERRDDLPGKPLTLDVALQNLVAQLLDRDL